jgi:hypothetical protein
MGVYDSEDNKKRITATARSAVGYRRRKHECNMRVIANNKWYNSCSGV